MKKESFYNTTGLSGTQLCDAESAAHTQSEMVLDFFRSHAAGEYTPFEVKHYVFNPNTLITSVRRAMTNLTSKGLLEKTDHMREGIYGRGNFTWRYRRSQEQLKLAI